MFAFQRSTDFHYLQNYLLFIFPTLSCFFSKVVAQKPIIAASITLLPPVPNAHVTRFPHALQNERWFANHTARSSSKAQGRH